MPIFSSRTFAQMMFCLLLASSAFAANIEVWDGTIKKGRISFKDNQFKIKNSKGTETLALSDVFEVSSRRGLAGGVKSSGRVILTDGSEITGKIQPCTSFGKIVLKRSGGDALTLRGKNLSAIVFNSLDPGARLDAAPTGSYVIMRSGKIVKCRPQWLTFFDLGITADAGKLRLKRKKIHMLVKGKPVPKKADANVLLKTYQGDSIHGKLQKLEGGYAVLTHEAGEISFPLSDLFSIEVLSPNVVSLMDIKPAKIETVPYFDFIRKPAFNRGLFGGSLRMKGIPFSKGVAMHSKTSLTYKVGGAYKRFVANFGMDVSVTDKGDAVLIIKGDGKELLKKKVTGDSDPLRIAVDLTGVNKLEIIFDYGKIGSGGDFGVLGHPRLIK